MMKSRWINVGLSTLLVLCLGTTSVVFAESNDSAKKDTSATKITGWINTRVPYDISAKELALRYYKDANDYMIIVNANKGLVGKNLIIKKDTEIKIPITPKFEDQPEFLGWK